MALRVKALRGVSGTLEKVGFYHCGLDSCACQSLSRVRLCATPWTATRQAPLSMDSPGKNTGVGCHFPSLGDLPDPGIEPRSPPLQADSLSSEPSEKLWIHGPTEMIRSLMKYLLKAYYIQGICVNINKDTRHSYQKKTQYRRVAILCLEREAGDHFLGEGMPVVRA